MQILRLFATGAEMQWVRPWIALSQLKSRASPNCEEVESWEGLGAGRGGEDRGWDGWMASPTWWTWVWVNSGSWWWTGKPGRPGMLRFMGLQSQTQLSNWTELNWETWLRKRYDVVVVQLLSHVWLFATPWTIAHQVSLSMGFSRQQYWTGCDFLLQGIFPTQGLNLHLLLGRWVLYHWATREAPKIQCGGVTLGQG